MYSIEAIGRRRRLEAIGTEEHAFVTGGAYMLNDAGERTRSVKKKLALNAGGPRTQGDLGNLELLARSRPGYDRARRKRTFVKALEKHLRVREIAKQWGLVLHTNRHRFENEPGVIRFTNSSRGKRKYTTLLIPVSVAERVQAAMSNGSAT